jgi:hypothetical protein
MSWPPNTGRRRHFRLTILSSEGSYPKACFKADDALFHSSSSLVYTAVPYEPPNEFGFSEIAWTTVGEIRSWGAIAFAIQEGKGFYSFYPLSGVSFYAATFDEQVLHRTALRLAARNPAQCHELHWVAAAIGEITQLYAALLRADNVLLRGVSCYLKSHMLWKHHFFMEEMGINLHIGRAVAFRDVYAFVANTFTHGDPLAEFWDDRRDDRNMLLHPDSSLACIRHTSDAGG